jgi:hypothetical protein
LPVARVWVPSLAASIASMTIIILEYHARVRAGFSFEEKTCGRVSCRSMFQGTFVFAAAAERQIDTLCHKPHFFSFPYRRNLPSSYDELGSKNSTFGRAN